MDNIRSSIVWLFITLSIACFSLSSCENKKPNGSDAETIYLRLHINVELKSKSYKPKGLDSPNDIVVLVFTCHNRSTKTIRGFTGRAVFNDMFDREIWSAELTREQPLNVNETLNINQLLFLDWHSDTARRFALTDISNIKFIWFPEKIVFSDGSSIGL